MPTPTPTQQAEDIADEIANWINTELVEQWYTDIPTSVKMISNQIQDRLQLSKLLSRSSICDGTGACSDGKCLMCQLIETKKCLLETSWNSALTKNELVEARKDTAMLDWIIKYGVDIKQQKGKFVVLCYYHNTSYQYSNYNLRTAISQAMKGQL